MAAPVMEAVEALESHLHPTPSFTIEDHPYPKGQEEIWRFSPLRALKPLLTDEPSDAHLQWDESLPAGSSRRTVSTDEARALLHLDADFHLPPAPAHPAAWKAPAAAA